MRNQIRCILFSTIIILTLSCSRRSNCPTYWDSDPKLMFGELSVEDRVKSERLMPTTPKKFQKENDVNPRKDKRFRKKKKRKLKAKRRKRLDPKL